MKIKAVANDIASDQIAQMHDMAREQAKKEIADAAEAAKER